MPMNQFSDDCPGCRPAILDLTTNAALPDDHPMMLKILKIWKRTTYEQRQAYHRVMCQNSRAVADLMVVKTIAEAMADEL